MSFFLLMLHFFLLLFMLVKLYFYNKYIFLASVVFFIHARVRYEIDNFQTLKISENKIVLLQKNVSLLKDRCVYLFK